MPVGKPARQQWLEWTAAEATDLLELLTAWLDRSEAGLQLLRRAERGQAFRVELDEDNFTDLGRVLRLAVIPNLPPADESLALRALALVRRLRALELDGRSALPLLLATLPAEAEALGYTTTSIRLALGHPSSAQAVSDGAEALCRWAYRFHQAALGPPPPAALLNEFLACLCLPDLPNLLAVVTWTADLLAAAPALFWPAHAAALGESLRLLAETTSLPTWVERNLARSLTAQEQLYQRPRVRQQAANLAGQLLRLHERTPVPAVEAVLLTWQQLATADPLPEVRRAWQKGRQQEAPQDGAE